MKSYVIKHEPTDTYIHKRYLISSDAIGICNVPELLDAEFFNSYDTASDFKEFICCDLKTEDLSVYEVEINIIKKM